MHFTCQSNFSSFWLFGLSNMENQVIVIDVRVHGDISVLVGLYLKSPEN